MLSGPMIVAQSASTTKSVISTGSSYCTYHLTNWLALLVTLMMIHFEVTP